MYKDMRVLDIHGHVSAPGGNGSQLVGGMMASNTATTLNPLKNDLPNLGFNEQSWANSVKRHTDQMDDHEIDAQLIGPRPFLMLGWMNKHLLPGWCRFINFMIAFILVAAAVFFLVVKPMNSLVARRKTEPEVGATVRDCPECLSKIPVAARRCAFCTAEVSPAVS